MYHDVWEWLGSGEMVKNVSTLVLVSEILSLSDLLLPCAL